MMMIKDIFQKNICGMCGRSFLEKKICCAARAEALRSIGESSAARTLAEADEADRQAALMVNIRKQRVIRGI